MPWASIIMFVLSFILSKKSGRSNAEAALIGTAAGAATYFLADPSNPDNLFEIGVSDDPNATGTADSSYPPSTNQPIVADSVKTNDGFSNVAGKLVDATGKTLQSWGPAGTAAVIGTTTLAKSDNLEKYIPWILGGLGVFLLLK